MKALFVQKIKSLLPMLLGIVALLLFYIAVGCPFRYFFGICCPGCGMTRAAFSIIKLDFAGAFHYHPLIFIMPLCAIVFLIRKRLPEKLYKGLITATVILFTGVYAYRLLTGNEHIYIDFTRGFIYQMVQYVITLF